MAYICDVHEELMSAVVNNHNNIRFSFECKYIEVVESLTISKESSCKAKNCWAMSISPLFMANYLIFLPKMNTLNNMSEISWILNIINNSFLSELRDNLSMEKYYVSNIEV